MTAKSPKPKTAKARTPSQKSYMADLIPAAPKKPRKLRAKKTKKGY